MAGTEAEKKREVKQNLSDTNLKIGLVILACIAVPLFYYADVVYRWCHENKPRDYKYPEYKQLWMTGMGAACFKIFEEMVTFICSPLYRMIVPKTGTDEIVWLRKVKKATTCTA